MTTRLPDAYFDQMYAGSGDPWQLSARWYEQRKYAITLAMLPDRPVPASPSNRAARSATLTAELARRCDHVTAVDVADAAVRGADARLREAGLPGPGDAEPVVAGRDVAARALRPAGAQRGRLLPAGRDTGRGAARECARLQPGPTIVAAHWRHDVAEYPLTGDAAHDIIAATPGLTSLGCYRDTDVVIEVFDTGDGRSVAAREGVPGAR